MSSGNIEYRLVIHDDGSKTIEEVDKAAQKGNQTLEKTTDESKKTEGGIKGLASSFGGLGHVIGLAAGALSGYIGIQGIKSIVSTTSELAEEADKFHSVTGLGAQASLDYVAALKARGVGTEVLTTAYGALSKNLQTAERQQTTFATGQEKAYAIGRHYTSQLGVQAEAFEQLGIGLNKFKGESSAAQLAQITKKFEAMKPGMEKTRLEMLLFGRGGKELAPLLEKGALSLGSFTAKAKEFFPTLKGGKNVLEELQAAQGEGKLAWEGLEFTIGTKLAPVLSEVFGWFSKLIDNLEHGHGTWQTVRNDATDVWEAIKNVWHWVEHSKPALHGLEDAAAGLAAAWGVEKVIKFGEALKGLSAISTVTSGVKLLKGAFLGLPAEEEAAAGATTAAGLSMDTLMPELAALVAGAAALSFISEQFGNNKETHAQKVRGEQLREVPKIKATLEHPAKIKQELQHLPKSERESIHAFQGELNSFVRHPGSTVSQVSRGFEHSPAQGQPDQDALVKAIHDAISGVQIHVHPQHELHLNGTKVGDALSRDTNAMRKIGEGVERNAQFRQARRG